MRPSATSVWGLKVLAYEDGIGTYLYMVHEDDMWIPWWLYHYGALTRQVGSCPPDSSRWLRHLISQSCHVMLSYLNTTWHGSISCRIQIRQRNIRLALFFNFVWGYIVSSKKCKTKCYIVQHMQEMPESFAEVCSATNLCKRGILGRLGGMEGRERESETRVGFLALWRRCDCRKCTTTIITVLE